MMGTTGAGRKVIGLEVGGTPSAYWCVPCHRHRGHENPASCSRFSKDNGHAVRKQTVLDKLEDT